MKHLILSILFISPFFTNVALASTQIVNTHIECRMSNFALSLNLTANVQWDDSNPSRKFVTAHGLGQGAAGWIGEGGVYYLFSNVVVINHVLLANSSYEIAVPLFGSRDRLYVRATGEQNWQEINCQ